MSKGYLTDDEKWQFAMEKSARQDRERGMWAFIKQLVKAVTLASFLCLGTWAVAEVYYGFDKRLDRIETKIDQNQRETLALIKEASKISLSENQFRRWVDKQREANTQYPLIKWGGVPDKIDFSASPPDNDGQASFITLLRKYELAMILTGK